MSESRETLCNRAKVTTFRTGKFARAYPLGKAEKNKTIKEGGIMEVMEIGKLPNGIEEYISGFEPATGVIWSPDKGKFVIDDSPKTLEAYKNGCEAFKNAISSIYKFGKSVTGGMPEFCLALSTIWKNGSYVQRSDGKLTVRFDGLLIVEDYGWSSKFEEVVRYLGISSTSAYRYKDMAIFVNPETKDYYPEFKEYSFSLLYEMFLISKDECCYGVQYFKSLTEIISSDTTIDDIRLYRKALKELGNFGRGALFAEYDYSRRGEIKKKPLPEVLELYNELLQKRETKKLEETMSGVNAVAKEDKSLKILPAPDEMIVKKVEYEKLKEVAKRAGTIGVCDGCKHNGANLNKCRCCCRYEKLKDLFENQ